MNDARAVRRTPALSDVVLFGSSPSAAVVLCTAFPDERAVGFPTVARSPAIRILHVAGVAGRISRFTDRASAVAGALPSRHTGGAGVFRGDRIGVERAT